MRQKSTNDLNQELMAQPNLDKYITENETHFTDVDISAFLLELYERCRLSKAELARQAGMSEVYLHQVFSGTACCAFAPVWRPGWRTSSGCSSRRAMPPFTPS